MIQRREFLSAITSFLTTVFPLSAFGDPAQSVPSCSGRLTLRWTSGEPIRLDVRHPSSSSLQNPPFLVDPKILLVTTGRDQFGANLTMEFADDAAKVLAVQSSTHLGQQLLIMLDDAVLSAAIVRGPVHDVVVLSGPYNGEQLNHLAEILRMRRNAPCANAQT